MPAQLLSAERLCPACGYDLRAAPVVSGELLCPECGRRWGQGIVSSRIPWMHRRRRGRLRAYGATLWILLRHGRTLGAEIQHRLPRSDARRFAQLSRWIAWLIAMAAFAAGFAIQMAGPSASLDLGADDARVAWWLYPVLAACDKYLFLPAIALWLWIALRTIAWTYRWTLSLGGGSHRRRSRMRLLGHYASALLPVEAFLLGAALLLVTLAEPQLKALVPYLRWINIGAIWSMLAALGVFSWCTGALVAGADNLRLRRAVLLAALSPLVAAAAGLVTFLAVMGSVGYLALAVWSMRH